jgi:hypothetical protein
MGDMWVMNDYLADSSVLQWQQVSFLPRVLIFSIYFQRWLLDRCVCVVNTVVEYLLCNRLFQSVMVCECVCV